MLKPGVHFLNATIELGPEDSGLTITAAPGSKPGSVVVSGGVLLTPTWTKSGRKGSGAATIWETPVPAALKGGFKGLTTLNPHRRVTRARYPNAGPTQGAELCTDCWTHGVVRWHHNTTCVGKARTVYLDLRDCDDDMKLPDGLPCKNDSAMWDTYNTYSNGARLPCLPSTGPASATLAPALSCLPTSPQPMLPPRPLCGQPQHGVVWRGGDPLWVHSHIGYRILDIYLYIVSNMCIYIYTHV